MATVTGGARDVYVDDDKIFSRASIDPDHRNIENVFFIAEMLKNIERERYKLTLLLILLDYRQADIARILGVAESTLHRYDMQSIRNAYKQMAKMSRKIYRH